MKINRKRNTMMILTLSGLLGPAAAVADQSLPTGYVMNYFADSAQGTAVGDGAYEVVIKKLTKKDAMGARRITDQINLCVAYTKTKQLDKAVTACDQALVMASRRPTRLNSVGFNYAIKHRASEQRAIALVNRGVLHAVAGDDDMAKAMFEKADDLDVEVEAATLNLLVLQREIAERDS
jgi:tetratricopeptide (TPR) repeat protein